METPQPEGQSFHYEVEQSHSFPDALESDPDIHEVMEETETYRAFRVRIPPGYRSSAHSHPVNRTIVLSEGRLRVEMPEKDPIELHLTPGLVMESDGGPHIIHNVGETEINTIQIEFKTPQNIHSHS